MSLLLLFGNIPNISTDKGCKPTIVLVDVNIPQIEVNMTSATFTNTSTTYNASDVSYNSSNQVYGGVDSRNFYPPKFDTTAIKPILVNVGS